MSNLTSFSAATPLTLVPASVRLTDSLRDRGVERAVGSAVARPVLIATTGGFGPAVGTSIHNSIKPMGAAPVVSTMAGHRAYAAKQAAPPRGRHR